MLSIDIALLRMVYQTFSYAYNLRINKTKIHVFKGLWGHVYTWLKNFHIRHIYLYICVLCAMCIHIVASTRLFEL